MNDLGKLRNLILFGCWIDGDFSFPPFGAPKGFENSKSILPFVSISHHIETIEFLNCDNRSVASLLYLRWDKLKTIKIKRSFNYPQQDGIEIIDYIILIIVNNYIERFPNLDKIVIGFHNMETMIPSKPELVKDISGKRIERWVEIKKVLESQTRNAPFQIDIVGPDSVPSK